MKISKKSIGVGIALGLLLWAGLNIFSGKKTSKTEHHKGDTLIVFCGFIDPYTRHARIDSAALIIVDSPHIMEDDRVEHRRDSVFYVTVILPLADPKDPTRVKKLKTVTGEDSLMYKSIPIQPSQVFQIWGNPVIYHAPVQQVIQQSTPQLKQKDTVVKSDSAIKRKVVK